MITMLKIANASSTSTSVNAFLRRLCETVLAMDVRVFIASWAA